MIRILLTLVLAGLAVPVEARQPTMHPDCNTLWPCQAPSISTPEQARVTRGRYVARQVGFGAPIVKPAVRAPRKRRAPGYEPSPVMRTMAGMPSRYIAGSLICAVNVGAALAERGIKGTGSALALSYLKWGRSAGGPVVGSVIVSARGRRGGHVAIVSRVENGVVYAWNATGGQRGWREIPYRHRVIDYRVPG